MTEIIALGRFQATGYVRSLRALYPFIAVVLLIGVLFADVWGGDAKRMLPAFADMAAMMFPIWAFAAKGLIDSQPDAQHDVSAVAVGTKARWIAGGLLTAYVVNLALAILPLGWLVSSSLYLGVDAGVITLGVLLHLLAALPATLVGAWTTRALLAKPSAAVLALLTACVGLLLLSIGPLRWLSVPMIGWMRAAAESPTTFAVEFPGLSVQILVWSAVVTAAYVVVRRRRP